MQENPATLAVVAITVGILGTITVGYRGETTRHIVTKSPCLTAPDSAACAAIREDVARAEPIRNPCIGYQRVTRTRGRACPKDFIDLQRRRAGSQLQANSKFLPDLELKSDQGSAPASDDGSDGTSKGTSRGTPGGTKTEPRTQKPTSDAESQPPTTDTSVDIPPVTSEVAPEEDPPNSSAENLRQPLKETLEGVGAVVKEAVKPICPLTERLLGTCP